MAGTPLKYLSVCSGIEAATVAWHNLGWTPWAFAEVDSFPSAVLAHHYPHVPNLGDITKWEQWPDATIDILVGGTPCQSFSVAGKRGGMDDARGKLALSFSAIAGRYKPRYVVWENVPGVLSSGGGRDFGAFIQALVELGYGVCWRVLDAQYVRAQRHPRAVPQRRRRVFVVGCLGSWHRAAAILFVRESLCRDSAKGGKARKSAARNVAPSLVSSGRGVERTGESRGQDPVVVCEAREEIARSAGVGATAGGSWWDGGQVSQTLDAVLAKGQTMPEKNRFPAVLVPKECQQKAAWIPCPDCDDFWCNIHEMHTGDCECPPIDEWETDPYGMQLDGPAARQTIVQMDQGGTVSALKVRRLTPTECERLQGFPDGYTLVPYRNKPAADGPRYKALGNSMAVNCMAWIGERIAAVEGL